VRKTLLPLLLSLLCIGAGTTAGVINAAAAETSETAPAPLPDGLYATFHTPRGAITAQLFPDEVPLTVANFVGLAEGTIPFEGRPAGKPFYDGLVFHRVVADFVVQGGDPLGNGEGGPGYEFQDEFSPRLKHDAAGVLAMANSGPNTNGSQFYFTLAAVHRLDYKHTVFGRVVRGLDVLPNIEPGDLMTRVEIVRVGAKAEAFHPTADSFAALRASTRTIAPRDPALPPLFADEAGLELPDGAAQWIDEKLNNYAGARGITIWVRALKKFDAPPPEASTKNPLRYLHAQLAGADANSATLVYVANEKRWRVWIGDGLLGHFGLTPETASQDPGMARLHEAKLAMLAAATKQLQDGVPRRSVHPAITGVIEALDQPSPAVPAVPDKAASAP
jgi:cyclophilin family peptidyl-prolyl cis-trans isomerase